MVTVADSAPATYAVLKPEVITVSLRVTAVPRKNAAQYARPLFTAAVLKCAVAVMVLRVFEYVIVTMGAEGSSVGSAEWEKQERGQ
jgi:hypothetical protein